MMSWVEREKLKKAQADDAQRGYEAVCEAKRNIEQMALDRIKAAEKYRGNSKDERIQTKRLAKRSKIDELDVDTQSGLAKVGFYFKQKRYTVQADLAYRDDAEAMMFADYFDANTMNYLPVIKLDECGIASGDNLAANKAAFEKLGYVAATNYFFAVILASGKANVI